jgi:ribulose-5-phosphate 4-epimerase/fuculose-1-phosphate aldolase
VTEDEAREEIVRLGRALYDRGITPGRTGNLSVRQDDRILITPTNSCLGRLSAHRLSLVSADGTLLAGDRPSKELALHIASYHRDRDSNAIAHAHSTYAVAVSCLADLDPAAPFPTLTPYFAMRVGTLRLLPYFAPGDPELATALRSLPDAHCALMAHHGSIASSTDLESAVDAIEEIEAAAKVMLLLHGRDFRTLPEDQIRQLRRT